MKTLIIGVALTVAGVVVAPVARADMALGNYELQIQGRYDFHTWCGWFPDVTYPAAGCRPPDVPT